MADALRAADIRGGGDDFETCLENALASLSLEVRRHLRDPRTEITPAATSWTTALLMNISTVQYIYSSFSFTTVELLWQLLPSGEGHTSAAALPSAGWQLLDIAWGGY